MHFLGIFTRLWFILFVCLFAPATSSAQESLSDVPGEVLAGHSFHGEAFNEGPRQAAYIMRGMGNVVFPVSTQHELAQQFINQGVAQLHGFWYYEAERSFRQAAQFDPDCAMAYWGMAMANVENRKRARGFIAQAAARQESVSARERHYIEAFEKFCRDEDEHGTAISKKTRAQTYTRDLEDLVVEFADDVEAQAFLALQLWRNGRADLPIVSHVAIDRLLQDIFEVNPQHPAHHYRIHLWDKRKPERALASATQCGQSLPGIAHMWHMPGHIFSNLHRYQEAVWQQEASARVDHAHMMRDRVMPDQIHNYAHNNEWLIRNLLKIGRVDDALSLAKNMLELPRHPKVNTLKEGSSKYGRQRLLLTLSTYRLWSELIELSQTMYLEATDDRELQVERTRYLGIAHALTGQAEAAAKLSDALDEELLQVTIAVEQLETAVDGTGLCDETAEEAAELTAETTGGPSGEDPQVGAPLAVDNAIVDAEAADTEVVAAETNRSEAVDTDPGDPDAGALATGVVAAGETKAGHTDAAIAVSEDSRVVDPESAQTEVEDLEDGSYVSATDSPATDDADSPAEKRRRNTKQRADALEKLKQRRKQLLQAVAAVKSAQAAARRDYTGALQWWEKSDLSDNLLKSEWLAASGQMEVGLALLEEEIERQPGEVLPLAVKTWLQYAYLDQEEARHSFELTRGLAATADVDTELLARLLPIAMALRPKAPWTAGLLPVDDSGLRPELPALGPFRWSTYQAPEFTVLDTQSRQVELKQLAGRPTLVIFYLGFGCLHCVEQLHAFSPRAEQFRESGIDIIGISSEDLPSLTTALEDYAKPLDIRLHVDPDLSAFRAYRCYDDFERQPLHGTFLIDPGGRVLWQDISYEPFMDVDFALSESHRLLRLAGFGDLLHPPRLPKPRLSLPATRD